MRARPIQSKQHNKHHKHAQQLTRHFSNIFHIVHISFAQPFEPSTKRAKEKEFAIVIIDDHFCELEAIYICTITGSEAKSSCSKYTDF